jgi:vacuolar-type H+-ATPase subunit I/STV1
MRYADYLTPLVSGAVFLAVPLYFSSYVSAILQLNNFSTELFTFSSLLFGLILTSYSMLFGVLPLLKRDFRKSTIMKEINLYFRVCLLFLLIGVISSVVYFFVNNYLVFLINIFFLGLNIGFLGYILFLINDIFQFVTQESI